MWQGNWEEEWAYHPQAEETKCGIESLGLETTCGVRGVGRVGSVVAEGAVVGIEDACEGKPETAETTCDRT